MLCGLGLTVWANRPASATTFYISAKGDDANAGTSPSRAWRTLARANRQTFAPGNSLRLRGGDTFAGNLVFDGNGYGDKAGEKADADTNTRESGTKNSGTQWVTVGSYGAGRATVQAGSGTGILVCNRGGFLIENLIVVGAGRGVNKGDGIKVVNTLPNSVRLSDIVITGVAASGFGGEGIVVNGEPNDNSQSGFENVRITNCLAHDNVYYGIHVTGVWDTSAKTYANRNVVIAHCVVYDNSGDPDYLQNHSGSGILLDDCDTGRIEYCLARHNGFLCNCKIGGPCGIWTHAADRITIRFCISTDNATGAGLDGAGFDFDGGVTNSVLENCYSRNNDGAGFLVYNYNYAPHTFHDNTVQNCISDGDGLKNEYAGMFVRNDGSGVRNVTLAHNIVLARPSHRGGKPRAVLVYKTDGVTLRENVLIASGGVPLLDLGANQPGLTLRDNTYQTGFDPFLVIWGGKSYSNIADWLMIHQQNVASDARTVPNDFRYVEQLRRVLQAEIGTRYPELAREAFTSLATVPARVRAARSAAPK